MKKLIQLDNHISIDLPCLSLDGSAVFAATADQRFIANKNEFLQTHYPIRMQSRQTGRSTVVEEQALLEMLLSTSPSVIGNRVIVLYGAAGSGKSELLRWLQTEIEVHDPARADVTMRISRTELDIFHITQRFYGLNQGASFSETTLLRWTECRQKPRTLAKLLVLSALEQLLTSDEQINAIYYQLIDIVQTNLEQSFAIMDKPDEDYKPVIELFSRENLDMLLRESVITIPLEYETLRYHLLKKFREFLLEELDLPRTLKNISQQIKQERNIRPILLIDDLVQSINLFSSDLLDYFITLEEGCWDVIIGITPNSLETNGRGKELLDRITFLDTIDDRVQKLWLSDAHGLSSSFLNEENCTEYARLYLNAFKQKNARPCNSSCPAFARCKVLEPDKAEDLLAPFNKAALVRLFRSLPENKGKVRYFTLYLQEILIRLSRGEDFFKVFSDYVRSDIAIESSSQQISHFFEVYSPLNQAELEDIQQAKKFKSLVNFIGLHEENDFPADFIITPLYENETSFSEVVSSDTAIDANKEAIKHWLSGKEVNRQQFRNLRRGVTKAIKDSYALDMMTRLHSAKPTRVLRWGQTHFDTVPPIRIEAVDDFDGLLLKREVGSLAYLLCDFADTAGRGEQAFRARILSHRAYPTLLFEGTSYRNNVRQTLEKQLGTSIEKLAYVMLLTVINLGAQPIHLPPFLIERREFQSLPFQAYPESIEVERPRLTNSQVSLIRRLFDDCFKLRENVYDGFLLEEMADNIGQAQAAEILMQIDVNNVDRDLLLNEKPLSQFLKELQDHLITLEKLRVNSKVQTILINFFFNHEEMSEGLPGETWLAHPGDSYTKTTNFLQSCTVFELHHTLLLAQMKATQRYDQLREQINQFLCSIQNSDLYERNHYDYMEQRFSKEDIEALARFSQQDYRIGLKYFDLALLEKFSNVFPELYPQLELRLQKG